MISVYLNILQRQKMAFDTTSCSAVLVTPMVIIAVVWPIITLYFLYYIQNHTLNMLLDELRLVSEFFRHSHPLLLDY